MMVRWECRRLLLKEYENINIEIVSFLDCNFKSGVLEQVFYLNYLVLSASVPSSRVQIVVYHCISRVLSMKNLSQQEILVLFVLSAEYLDSI